MKPRNLSDDNSKARYCAVCRTMVENEDVMRTHIFIHAREYRDSLLHSREALINTNNPFINSATHLYSAPRRSKRSSNPNKPHACNCCDIVFATKAMLHEHRRLHAAEKPYQCHVCGKLFRQKSTLNSHIEAHGSEQLFFCHVCKKTYGQKQLLEMHMLTHITKTTCTCNFCEKVRCIV